jgi:hypothetical protein
MATWTERLSGYLATAISIAWSSGQTFDSATDNEYTDLSNEVDNSTNKYPRCDLEIVLGSAAFTGTDSGIEVYIVPSVDGTNYPTWTGNGTTDEQENNGFFVGFASTTGTTAAQRMVIRDINLPNGKYKWAFRNRGNVTLASSGNSASFRPHGAASTDA